VTTLFISYLEQRWAEEFFVGAQQDSARKVVRSPRFEIAAPGKSVFPLLGIA
jgi:hypothetical protein